MIVEKKDLEKSLVELSISLDVKEFQKYIEKGAKSISESVKIDGFRQGKIPYEILKKKVGEMAILEEAARFAINEVTSRAIKENVEKLAVGQPEVEVVKLAPDNPFEYKIKVAVLPKVTLGGYKDLKIKEIKVDIKEDEIDKMLENLREMKATEVISDSVVNEDSKVLCDIEMFLDNVPVEGGQHKGVAVVMGKDYIVPGFDKKILGAKKDEVRDFSLPYPEDYHMKNLAGKMVEFKVKIVDVYIRELPELNDEFAKMFQAKDMKDFRDNMRKSLQAEKDQEAKQKNEISILDKIIEKAKFGDIPEVLIQHESDAMLQEVERGIVGQGGKFEDYLASIKKTRAEFMLDIVPQAIKRVKSALAIREISEAEKITVDDSEVDKKIAEMLEQYKGYEKVEARVKEPGYKDHLKNVMVNGKVMDRLREWNLVK